jgi:hypothetical protein
MLYPPSSWTNGPVRSYHGTVDVFANAIVSSGVNVGLGRTGTDFGPGFYTTTLERQAKTWAHQLAIPRGARAAVVAIDVGRDALASLDTLAFVRGDFDAEEFWSLVVHCRRGASHHARAGVHRRAYDVVIGPVASFWQQRLLIQGVDQMSFHTPAAERVLNSSTRSVSWISSP